MRALKQKTIEIERALSRRGTLTNEIAHEIKNPITAILCSAETLDLLLADKIDPEQRDLLGYIKEYGDNLLRLVSDFLDVSMAEAGNIKARPEPLALAPLTQSIVGLLQSNAQKKHISLKCIPEDPEIGAMADPRHLKQVIFNLVHNAIKFTSDHGEVKVSVCSHSDPGKVRILVTDNGFGISREDLPTVFDPYARGEAKHIHGDTGAGLGLALCKALVELNGGTIGVDSLLNVGTTFEVTLPSAMIPRVEKESRADNMFQPLLGQRFLIIDEDFGSREAISALIEAWGGAVDKVAMAVEAVNALAQRRYDAVMIDNPEEGGLGYELARKIREDFKAQDTTIIIASKNPIDARLAKQAGADKCVEKPLNGKVLLHSLLAPREIDVM